MVFQICPEPIMSGASGVKAEMDELIQSKAVLFISNMLVNVIFVLIGCWSLIVLHVFDFSRAENVRGES